MKFVILVLSLFTLNTYADKMGQGGDFHLGTMTHSEFAPIDPRPTPRLNSPAPVHKDEYIGPVITGNLFTKVSEGGTVTLSQYRHGSQSGAKPFSMHPCVGDMMGVPVNKDTPNAAATSHMPMEDCLKAAKLCPFDKLSGYHSIPRGSLFFYQVEPAPIVPNTLSSLPLANHGLQAAAFKLGGDDMISQGRMQLGGPGRIQSKDLLIAYVPCK